VGSSRTQAGLGRAFQGLWAAAGAANLADGVALVLLPLAALPLASSPGQVAAVAVATTAAWPVLGLPAGWIVDRFDRRRILVAVNVIRSLALATLATAVATGRFDLWVVYTTAVLLSAGETLADTALTSLVPMIVTPDGRSRANTRIETTINLLNQLAGPPLAGVLVSIGVSLTAGVAAGLYAATLLGLAMMPRRSFAPPRPADPPSTSWARELAAGLVLLWQHPVLRVLTVVTAAMNVVWAVWTALFVVHAVAPGPLGLSTGGYGVLLSAMAVGGLLAAALVAPLTSRLRVRTVLMLDLLGTVLLVAPTALGLSLPAVAFGVVVAGSGATIWRVLVATIRHNMVPEQLMGRVYAASRLISWGVLPVGAGLAGLVADAVGVRVAFAAATALALLLVVAFPAVTRSMELDRAYTGTDPSVALSQPSPGRSESRSA
jgi:MFS family permease